MCPAGGRARSWLKRAHILSDASEKERGPGGGHRGGALGTTAHACPRRGQNLPQLSLLSHILSKSGAQTQPAPQKALVLCGWVP